MKVIYEHEGNIFESGDLVCVEHLNIFNMKVETYKGRLLDCGINSMIELDMSESFKSKKVSLDIGEVKSITLI